VSILGVSGLTADGGERLRLEQRGRVERLNGLTLNLPAPMRTNPQLLESMNHSPMKECRISDDPFRVEPLRLRVQVTQSNMVISA
jgi:hypothetical protein